jgi:hypothetical protein
LRDGDAPGEQPLAYAVHVRQTTTRRFGVALALDVDAL